MVAVAFAVRGHVHQFRLRGRGTAEAAGHAQGITFARVEQIFKGDGTGARAVIEKDGDGFAAGQPYQVGPMRVHCCVFRRLPACVYRLLFRRGSRSRCRLTHGRALVRREHGKGDAVFGEYLQRLRIHRGLCQPHAFRLAAEAMLKVGNAPAYLQLLVAAARKRHDDVVVDLRHGRAVAGKPLGAEPVRMQDGSVRKLGMFSQPRQ